MFVSGGDILQGWYDEDAMRSVCRSNHEIGGVTWLPDLVRDGRGPPGKFYCFFKRYGHSRTDDANWRFWTNDTLPILASGQCESWEQVVGRPIGRDQWRVRTLSANSIPIRCTSVVDIRAITEATRILDCMLLSADAAVTDRMIRCGVSVAIIGRHEVTTDVPEHRHLLGTATSDGRIFDSGTRGVGGTVHVPVTSVGEENLLMENDRHYPDESVLVHEFAHTVMNCGFDETQQAAIRSIYNSALRGGYNRGLYMFSNEDEFFAICTQAWFSAICRVDMNMGITCREKLKSIFPDLVDFMTEVYGDNSWQYVNDCPKPWNHHPERRRVDQDRLHTDLLRCNRNRLPGP